MRHVTCPICGGVQGVESPVASYAQCAFCRAQFIVPPAPLASRSAHAAAPPAPPAPPAPAPHPHGALPDDRQPARAPALVPRGMLLEFTFFGLFAAIFVAGLVVVLLATGRWKVGDPAKTPRVEEVVMVRNDPPEVEPRWSNASRITLQLDGVKTRIDHVEYSAVFARDDQRRVVTTKSSYLTIWVHVENQRAEPAEYRSWYGNRFQQTGRTLEAKLVDNHGVVYPQKKLDDVREIKGHIASASLAMRDETRDTIVFEVPADVQRSDVSGFRLELPGAAFGGEGFLRFEIGLGLVEGW